MIDLAVWNLTIPVGTPVAVIDTPALMAGYQDQYFRASNGTLFFWAPVSGGSTANSDYPRSELRETYNDGRLHNWTYAAADNFLRASLEVDQVPSLGKVVVGQIHAYQSDKPLLKLEYQYKNGSGTLVAKYRNKPTDTDAVVYTVAKGVKLDQRFAYTIHLSPKGSLSVTVAGYNWVAKLDPSWAPKPLYFKAGIYVQDNAGASGEGGKATFYKLESEHRAI